MENFFRKYGWTVTLAFVGIGALLLALMANNILASQLAPYTVPEIPDMGAKTAHKTNRSVQRNRSRNWDRTIAQLCLFGCPDDEPKNECPGGCPDGQSCQAGQCVPDDGGQPVDSDVPVLSDLNMKMMGAMVARPNEYSMALIRDEDSNETLVVSPGDALSADATLVEIRRDRVILERNGHREYIRMDKSIGGEPSATPVSTLPNNNTINTPSLRHVRPSPKPSANAVKKVGNDQFQVKREAINKQLNDRKNLARQGRVVPNFKNGKRDGLKLVGISPNSVYQQLGIQSGDVIHSVNGRKITTSQQALELFDKMKSEKKVSIEIERRGQKHRLEYKIR